MRTVFAIAALSFMSVVPAAAQSPAPLSATASPAPAEVLQCAPRTRCLTAEMIPIGTPVKFTVLTGFVAILSKLQKITGQATLEVAEDVVVNGHLIAVHGSKPLYFAISERDFYGWTVPVVLPCSMSVSAGWIWTQDFQKLPVSFSDPKTNGPNLLPIPMVPAGSAMCRVSNLPVTAYVSGPPSPMDAATPPKPR